MKLFIKNGTVVFEQKVELADIEITDGVITKIGTNLRMPENAGVIEAAGKYVLPGIVDFHTHLGETVGMYNSNESYTTGTYTGILNGVTTVNCFIVQDSNHSLVQSISSTQEKAKNKIYSDVRWHLTPTKFNDVNFAEITKLIDKGFNTFKFYTTYKNANLFLAYDKISEFIKRVSTYDPTIMIHCEEDSLINSNKMFVSDMTTPKSIGEMRNEEVELNAVERIIEICKNSQTDTVIAHVSASDAMGQIELAKRECPIMSEVTPANIFLNENHYDKVNGHRYHVIPPLRSDYCMRLMEKKVLLNYAEIFSSNHRSYSLDNKDRSKNDIRNVPQGIPSIGALFHLFTKLFLNNPEFPFYQYYRKLSSNPARLSHLYPKKGVIAEGSDADILVVDFNAPERDIYGTLTPNSFNPWEGMTSNFAFDYVLLRGKIMVRDGKIVDEKKMMGEILTPL
jgi:dihydropyrimidinase